MPAPYSGLFDSVLVVAGLIRIIIGRVMSVRSKNSGEGWSVEVFGVNSLRAVW